MRATTMFFFVTAWLPAQQALVAGATPFESTVAAAAGDRWPGFRGVGTGHTLARRLPIEWSAEKNLAWKLETIGYGQSSPIIWKDKVFVTSVEGPNKERCYVSCHRLSDGKPLWIRSFAAGIRIKSSKMVSRGAPTPLVDESRIYAFFESGDMFALDHDGNRIWHRCLTREYGEFEGNHGVGSSVVGSEDAIVLLLDHSGPSYLLCLDKRNGENRWKRARTSRSSWSTPALAPLANGFEVVVSSNGSVDGFALDSGELRWSVDGIQGNTVPSPTVVGHVVLVGASSKGAGNLAVTRPSGNRKASVAWREAKPRPSGFASPTAVRDSVYLVNRAGVLSCLKLSDGEFRWKQRLAQSCWASPIAAGNRLYFFGKSGTTTVVEPEAGGAKVLAQNELVLGEEGEIVYGAAAVDGAFVIRTGQHLACIRQPSK